MGTCGTTSLDKYVMVEQGRVYGGQGRNESTQMIWGSDQRYEGGKVG